MGTVEHKTNRTIRKYSMNATKNTRVWFIWNEIGIFGKQQAIQFFRQYLHTTVQSMSINNSIPIPSGQRSVKTFMTYGWNTYASIFHS